MVAICDTNSDPRGIRYPVPGNDDASRAINLYCDLMVQAVLDGIQAEMAATGVDVGEMEEVVEELPEVAPETAEVAAEPAPEAEGEAVTETAPAAETGESEQKQAAAAAEGESAAEPQQAS